MTDGGALADGRRYAMKPGYFVFRDGEAWCAVGPHFTNYQESLAGCGPTKEEAIAKLVSDPRFQIWLKDVNGGAPKLSDFKEEVPWSEPADAGAHIDVGT
jgi:hypothetical protein